MHIKQVELHNFKGRTLRIQLEPACVITGSNMVGKTAIVLGIRFALTGTMPPPLGRTNHGMWRVAGHGDQPGQCSATVTFDDRMNCTAKLTRNVQGTVSLETSVPVDRRLPELLVEPNTFFWLTQQEKILALFAACDVDGASLRAKLVDALQALELPAGGSYTQRLAETALHIVDSADWRQPAQAIQVIAKLFEDHAKAAKRDYESARTRLIAARAARENRPQNPTDAELAAAEAAVNYAQRPADPDRTELDRAEWALADLKHRLAASEREYQAAERAVAESAEDTESGAAKCPTCGRPFGKRDREKRRRQLIDTAAQAGAAWAALRAQYEKQNAEIIPIRERYNAALAEARAGQQRWVESTRQACERLELLRAQRRAWEDWQRANETFAAIGDQCGELELEQLFYRSASKAAADVMRSAVQDAVSGLMDAANELLADGILPTPLELRNGQLGRTAGPNEPGMGQDAVGSWIPHESFSGAEAMLAYAAFAYALTRKHRGPRILVLDELGRMSRDLFPRVLRRFMNAVNSGRLDQFIGCMATDGPLEVVPASRY